MLDVKRKAVSGILVTLLLMSILTPIFNIQPVEAETTWIVDDDGPTDFSTIQEAINAASPGDTIIVKEGTYTENVEVNKDHLTIKSESGAESTIVQAANPDDHVLEITADYVNISRFTVKGATGTWPPRAGITLDNVKHCNISDNIVLNNFIGIYVYFYSSYNILGNNIIKWNEIGIELGGSYNTLRNNIIEAPQGEVGIEGSGSFHTLTNNIIVRIDGPGIWLQNCFNVTFIDNTIWGLWLFDASYNTLINNAISEYLWIYSTGPKLSRFVHNIDTSNTVNGKPVQYFVNREGLVIDSSWDVGYLGLVNCTDVTVQDLTLTNNGQGVLFAYSSNSRIENVTVSKNAIGIHLVGSSNNILSHNIASNNGYGGIRLDASNDNVIYLNNLVNNPRNVYSRDSANNWNSPAKTTYTYNGKTYTNYLGNYWSDYTGTDADVDGIGDTPYSIDGDEDHYPLMESFEYYEGVAQLIESVDISVYYDYWEYDIKTTTETRTTWYLYNIDKTLVHTYSHPSYSMAKNGTFGGYIPDGEDGYVHLKEETKDGDIEWWPSESEMYKIERPVPIPPVELEVDAYELSRSWKRDTTTDLPVCDIVISYSISNLESENAIDIQLIIKVDGDILIQDTIPTLDAGENYIGEFSLPIPYDSSRHVEITASTSGFSYTHAINVEAILPRDAQNYGALQKLYITPNDQVIQDTLEIILGSYPYPDWMAIRDWVGYFINYEPDVDPGYYQLPQETIQHQIGDCEDYATLLVSLLRANGWGPETVYVVYGINSNGDAHAWVILKFGPIWYSLNPTSTMICTLIGDFLYLYDYEAIYIFNDVYYEKIGLIVRTKSPVDIVVTDPDGLTISKQLNEIPKARYSEIDIDGDGDFDDQVVIMDRKEGDYIITVIPEPDASPTDTYTLEVSVDGVATILADDVQISDIPAQPYIIRSNGTEIIPIIPATIDFDPDTLALKSGGQWVTVYIELPIGHGYDVCDVSLEAIMLNDCICAETSPIEIGDYDDDGVADLMVKFDRQILIDYLKGQEGDMIELTVNGEVTGTRFEGFDTIQVIPE